MNINFILVAIIITSFVWSSATMPLTRLFFDNANCDGFHVGYEYYPQASNNATCNTTCSQMYPASMWTKEVCGTVVEPRYTEEFAVISWNDDNNCQNTHYETGAVLGKCIVTSATYMPQTNMTIGTSMTFSNCTGESVIQNTFSGSIACDRVSPSNWMYNKTCVHDIDGGYQYLVSCPSPNPPTTSAPAKTSGSLPAVKSWYSCLLVSITALFMASM